MNQVRSANYYSVIFDETTYVSHVEQLSLNLRYIQNNNIREDFVKLIYAYDNIKIINENEGKIVLNWLKDLHLDPKKFVGIGTDSYSVMSSEAVSAVKEIKTVPKVQLDVFA
ncbi:unnamed protein product [Diabrotica balteata]|uniref:Uncharacterized protein n=1 Tax=Diabrotica balteata TaxID=107213 RepID=A0A9N9TDL8_DIABA|nr:unnamed protein product [Diabrotica balteata]